MLRNFEKLNHPQSKDPRRKRRGSLSVFRELVIRKGGIENAVQKEFRMSVHELRDTVRKQEQEIKPETQTPPQPPVNANQPPPVQTEENEKPVSTSAVDPQKVKNDNLADEKAKQFEQKKSESNTEPLVSETLSVTHPKHAIPTRYLEAMKEQQEKQEQQGQEPSQPRHSQGRSYSIPLI